MPDSSSRLSPIVPVANLPPDALPAQTPPSPTAATEDDGKTPSASMNPKAGQRIAKSLLAECGQYQEDIPSAEQLAEQVGNIYKRIKKIGMHNPNAYHSSNPSMVENGELRRSEVFQAWKGLSEELRRAEGDPEAEVRRSDNELGDQTDKYQKICEEILTSQQVLRQEKKALESPPGNRVENFLAFLEKSAQRLAQRERESKELFSLIEALPDVPMSFEKIEYIKQLQATLRVILEDSAWMYRARAEVPRTFVLDRLYDLQRIQQMQAAPSSSAQDQNSKAIMAIVALKKKVSHGLTEELPKIWSGIITIIDAIRLVAEDDGEFEKNKNAIRSEICQLMCMHSQVLLIIDYPGRTGTDQATKRFISAPFEMGAGKGGDDEFSFSPEEREALISRAELEKLAETDYKNLPWFARFLEEFADIKNWATHVFNGALGVFGRGNKLNDEKTRELLVKLAPKLDEAAYNLDVLNADMADTLALYEQRSKESGEPASADSLTREHGGQLIADLTLRATLLREVAFCYRLYVRCLEPAVPAQRRPESERRIDVAADEASPAGKIPAAKNEISERPQKARREEGAGRKTKKDEVVNKAPPAAPAVPVKQKDREEMKRKLDDLLESAEQEVKAAIGQLARHYKAITPREHDNALKRAITMYIAAASDYADAKKIQSEFNFPDKPDLGKLEKERLHSYSEAVLLDAYAKHPLSFFEPPDGEALIDFDEAGGMQVCRSIWDYFRNLGTEDDPNLTVELFLRLSATMRSPKVTATKRMTRIVGFHGHVEKGLTLRDLKALRPDQIRDVPRKGRKEKTGSHTKLLSQLRVGDEGWQDWRRKGAAQERKVETDADITPGDVSQNHEADSNGGWQVWRPKGAQRRKVETYAHVMLGDVPRDYGADIIRRGAAATPERIKLGKFTKKF